MFGRGFFRGMCRHLFNPKILTRFRYLGPCKCGSGFHAFYVDGTGRLIHAWALLSQEMSEEERRRYLEERIRYLKEELRVLEDELKNIKRE